MQDRDKEAGVGKVIYDMSMSLDGFVTASNSRLEEPMGDGGLKLVEWGFDGGDERGHEVLERSMSEAGAVIVGRRTYDTSLPWWGADGPTGEKRLPVFVFTHAEPEETPPGGVYTFVTDGIESAVRQAKAAAGDKNVGVSGAEVGQRCIAAGLADEIYIHLVPVLFGDGIRMFEGLGGKHIQLEPVEVVDTRMRRTCVTASNTPIPPRGHDHGTTRHFHRRHHQRRLRSPHTRQLAGSRRPQRR